jgi:hypothetical protein
LGSGLTTTTAAIIPFFYYNGSVVTANAAMADRAPFIHAGENTPPRWENAGVLTASVTGDYIVYHYFATPMVGGWSIFSRPHNAKYASLAAALAASPTQLTWSNYAEIKHLYTAVFRVNTAWSNSHRCKLVSLRDFRLIAANPATAIAPTAHASLSGLELAGAGVTWGHIDDQAQTIAGVKTFESFLVTPNVDPTTDYQVANKRYADTRVSVTSVGSLINGAAEKTTPVDADMLGLMDSAASNVLKKLSWSSIKARLKAYFDTLYPSKTNVVIGTANSDADSVLVVNGTAAICASATQALKTQLEQDISTFFISANQYYSSGWVLYDTAKAGAAIRLNSLNADSSIAFYTASSNATAANTAQFTIAKTGLLYSMPTYNNTAAASANLVIDSNGIFYRATSSRKYKTDIAINQNSQNARA